MNLDLDRIHQENSECYPYWCGYLSEAIRSYIESGRVDLEETLENYDKYCGVSSHSNQKPQ